MASRDIMRHRTAGQESGAAGRHSRVAGDAVVQPEDAAERQKASGVTGMCSGTAEGVAVQRMPRGMLSRPGETLRNVAGWRWKSRQPGDAVRRQAEDGTMVGGGAGDRSGGGRRVVKRKTHLGAEDTSEGGGHIWRQKMHWKAEDTLEGGRHIGRWKTHWKAEDTSGAEAESETERRGIKGVPLTITFMCKSISIHICILHAEVICCITKIAIKFGRGILWRRRPGSRSEGCRRNGRCVV